jgi:hypothetical protein
VKFDLKNAYALNKAIEESFRVSCCLLSFVHHLKYQFDSTCNCVERWTGKDILKAQNNKNENYSLLYTSHELSTNPCTALHVNLVEESVIRLDEWLIVQFCSFLHFLIVLDLVNTASNKQ